MVRGHCKTGRTAPVLQYLFKSFEYFFMGLLVYFKKSSQGKAQPARGSVHEPLELKPMMSSSEPKAKCCYRSLARLSLQVGRLELSEVLITQCGKAGGSVFCD